MKKISTRFALFSFGAASLMALVGSPASAQTAGGAKCEQLRSMDKTKQCLSVRPEDRVRSFIAANPPTRSTDVIPPTGWRGTTSIVDGVDRSGRPYRIVFGAGGGIAGSGSASFLNRRPGGGGSGGKRSTN